MRHEIFDGLGLMFALAVICMVVVIVAMGVDLVSGWRKAKIRGEARTSYGFSRSLTKFISYEGILFISCGIDTLIHFAWWQFHGGGAPYCVPLATILFALVLCAVEAWSVREKAEEKTRHRIDKALEAVIQAVGRDRAAEIIREALRGKDGKPNIED